MTRAELLRSARRVVSGAATAPGVAPLAYLILTAWIVIAIAAPAIAPYDPDTQNLAERLTSPSGGHLFGTDFLGRDVFSLVVYGARLTIPVGFAAVILSVLLGTLAGSVAGVGRGLVDEVVMRTSDVVMSFPPLILALVITAALGAGTINAVVAIMAVWWPKYARLVRALFLSIREREFVVAAISTGGGTSHIVLRHILPNSLSPVIVLASLDVGNAILTFASLSFLGLGPPPGTAEWGAIIASSRDYFDVQWWIGTFPGIALLTLTLSLNVIGDHVRDQLDPVTSKAV